MLQDQEQTPTDIANALKEKKRRIVAENRKKAHKTADTLEYPLDHYVDLKALEKAAQADLTDKQLATVLGVHQKTIKKLRTRADFLDFIHHGKKEAKKAVESSLYASALGTEYEEVTRERVLIGRVRQLNRSEKGTKLVKDGGPLDGKTVAEGGSGHGQERIYSVKATLVITKTLTKRIAGDVEAQKFYLSNIDPSNWKIRSQTDANITKRVEFTELLGKTRDDMTALRDRIGKRVAEIKATKEAVVKN